MWFVTGRKDIEDAFKRMSSKTKDDEDIEETDITDSSAQGHNRGLTKTEAKGW